MDAMILAAGLGTRLRPYTENTPKCLLPIGDKPLVSHQIAWLKRYGLTNITINLHYLPEKVRSYLGDGSSFGVTINYSDETEKLMGTAGGVKKASRFLTSDNVLVVYGDILTDLDLDAIQRFHEDHDADLTICIRPKEGRLSNKIVLDGDGKITEFIEKPSVSQLQDGAMNLENCGVYILKQSVLDMISKNTFCDFAYDLFPRLTGKGLFGFMMPKATRWLEIGRVEKYHAALEELKQRKWIL